MILLTVVSLRRKNITQLIWYVFKFLRKILSPRWKDLYLYVAFSMRLSLSTSQSRIRGVWAEGKCQCPGARCTSRACLPPRSALRRWAAGPFSGMSVYFQQRHLARWEGRTSAKPGFSPYSSLTQALSLQGFALERNTPWLLHPQGTQALASRSTGLCFLHLGRVLASWLPAIVNLKCELSFSKTV